jgi:hypothetical protein
VSTLDDYVAKAQAAVEGIRPQLDELRVQADLAQAEARDRLQAGIAALQKAQLAAKAQLDQAARAGKDTWKTTAQQAEQAVDDLGTQLQQVAEQLQSTVGAAAPAAQKGWQTFLDEWNRERQDRQRLLNED